MFTAGKGHALKSGSGMNATVEAQKTTMTEIRRIAVRDCLADPVLEVMNFLNEIVLDYPDAISFAPGRPPEDLFHVKESVDLLPGYIAKLALERGIATEQAWEELKQYNRTNGTINHLISRQLAIDEGIYAAPENIIVTVGAQEAMAILLAGLFEPGRDILLASDPTYIGITSLAKILGIRVIPVPATEHGLSPEAVQEAILNASAFGKVKALYDIPDFNNPLGTSLPRERRIELIEVCRNHSVFIIEDNPYGMFCYEGERLPALKALDADGTVLYIGTFSKTLFPGIRLGYLIANQKVRSSAETLAAELSKVKSLITVNTPSLSQAVAAAALMASGYSLEPVVAPKRQKLQRNRDVLLESLAGELAGMEQRVTWNRPSGGFFITVTVPFVFEAAEMRQCAEQYNVILTPMSFFSQSSMRRRQIRLSFSCLEEGQISAGVARMAQFIRDRSGSVDRSSILQSMS